MVGRSLEHSFKALGLGLGATETEVKVAYRALARIYHPDKHDPMQTGSTQKPPNTSKSSTMHKPTYVKYFNTRKPYLTSE
jgi:curved DNA-binding protein CbpA